MIKKALAKGIAVRSEMGRPEEAKTFIDLGVRHFCIGTDTVILQDWCKAQEKAGLKSMLAGL
jgi:2-keto-3-deoxy-L-rhamnonate aldolase RhmA